MQTQGNVRRRSVLGVLLVLLVLLRFLWPVIRQMVPAVDSDPSAYYLAMLAEVTCLWLLPSLFFRPWRYRRLGEKRDVLPLTVMALPVGAALQVFSCGLCACLPIDVSSTAIPMPDTAGEWILAIGALVLLPAFSEEAFFRGSVTTHLLDVTKPWIAVSCASVLFALMHGFQTGLPAQLLVSVCCVLLMTATGRLSGPVLLHAGFNGTALLTRFLPASPWLMTAAIVPCAYIVFLCCRIRWHAGADKRIGREDLLMLVALFVVLILRML